MARRVLRIILELFAVSAVLAWLWLTQLRGLYAHFFSAVGTPLFSFLGMGDTPLAGYKEYHAAATRPRE